MQEESKEATILDYWNLVYGYRKLIITVTGIITVIALISSMMMPKVYTATVVALPPELEDMSKGGSMFNRGMFSPYGDIFGYGFNLSNIIVAMLKSRRMGEDTITELDLMKVFKQNSKSEALKTLNASTDISVSKEKAITFSVTTKDLKLSADIASFYIVNLDRMNSELQITSANPMIRVLDKAVPPEKKSGPSIRNNVAIAFVSAIFACLLFVFLREYFLALKISKKSNNN